MMQTHDVQQGTCEWLTLRRQYFTASEAPAMMGDSPYMTRAELLRRKATGIEPEIDDATRSRFNAGHAAETAYRPIAEVEIGQDLYPVTGTVEVEDLPLLASFDGLTMDERTGFEHKLWNRALAQKIHSDGDPGPAYYWQMEHQLLVSSADRILFATSDGTEDGAVWCWYTSHPERRERLIAGWKQFAHDLAQWQPESTDIPKLVGSAPQTLPALRLEISGAVTASNLVEFKAQALGTLASINRNLQTDNDFADAEQTVKWCGGVEARIKAAKEHALSQTASIDEAFRVMDDVSAEVRRVRLDLERLVKSEKEARRTALVSEAMQALKAYTETLNERLGRHYMPLVPADFAGAIKGKKNLDSMRDAVGAELARAKIEANAVAERIQVNLHAIDAAADATLFPDIAVLVLKATDDLLAVITMRKADAERKLAAERERIAVQEREKIAAEERSKIEAEERERIRKEEAAKLAAEQDAERAREAEARSHGVMGNVHPAAPAPTAAGTAGAGIARAAAIGAADPQPEPSSPPTLRLGQINQRLAPIALTADGLASLGFPHAATDKAARLYHERDFPRICDALIRHVAAVRAAQSRALREPEPSLID